jgi:hypothetical protein
MKDAVAYFGFRQVFHRRMGRRWRLMTRRELAAERRRAAVRRRAGLAGLAGGAWPRWRTPAGGCCSSRCFTLLPLASTRRQSCVSVRAGSKRRSPLRDSPAGALGGRIGQQPDAGRAAWGPGADGAFLAQRGMPMDEAAAAITVSTTMQTFAQIVCPGGRRRCSARKRSHLSRARAAHLRADRQRFSGDAGGRVLCGCSGAACLAN